MKVKEIIIYPVKGMKGVALSSCMVTDLGLADDRLYMLADEQGQLISQRTHIELALMHVSRVESAWEVTYQDEKCLIHDEVKSNRIMQVDVWGTLLNCNEVSKVTSAWFTQRLSTACKLMVMPNKQTRVKEFLKPPFKTYISFADGYPINTLGTKSLELLNQKLKSPIKANRFRPNIIIETNTPHEEDLWEDFMIGKQVKLRNIKPCVRCEVITIDQELGTRGKEPLKTLAKYRKEDNGVIFSSNVIMLEGGEIRVGDTVRLL